MANKKILNPVKVAVAGAALAAGTYAAVKLSKKENREKVKKLIQKYTQDGIDLARKAVDVVDQMQNVKKIVKNDGASAKKLAKKV